jgi:hypothetical protein
VSVRRHCGTRRFAGPACPQRRRSNAFSKLRHRRAGVSDPRTRSSAASAMAGRRIAIFFAFSRQLVLPRNSEPPPPTL